MKNNFQGCLLKAFAKQIYFTSSNGELCVLNLNKSDNKEFVYQKESSGKH